MIAVTKNIQIGITFNSKDLPLALKIKETLKGGFIVSKTKNSIYLIIKDIETVYKLISMINGKFRTPKIEALRDRILKKVNII